MIRTLRALGGTVGLLALCWALTSTGQTVLVSVSALAGSVLAVDKSLATLPIALQWAGTAMATLPASLLMARWGRRAGFAVGAVIGIVGASISAYALWSGAFALFAVGMCLLGAHIGFGNYYRYAAAEVAPITLRSTAIGLVLGGGVIAALLAPTVAKYGIDALPVIPFAGAYGAIAILAAVTIAVLTTMRLPRMIHQRSFGVARPTFAILRQPQFMVAVGGGVGAYAVMILIMSVTPLAMSQCGHDFGDAAFVIQWHVLSMFAPSFVTGYLIRRFGTLRIMMTGVILEFMCIGVASSGIAMTNFWLALVLLGIGWNFLFVGATDLMAQSFGGHDRARAQGINEFFVFGAAGLAALSSGALLHQFGWGGLNLIALPIAAVVGIGILTYGVRTGWDRGTGDVQAEIGEI